MLDIICIKHIKVILSEGVCDLPTNRLHQISEATKIVLYDLVRAINMPAGRQPKAEVARYGVRIVAILTASVVNMEAIC